MAGGGMSVVLLVALVSGISGGLLPIEILPFPIDLDLGKTVSTIVVSSTLIQAVTSNGYGIQYDLDNGIVSIGKAPNYFGLVALPLDTLCHIPGVSQYIACFICNDDCLSVHNTFGGKCGANPNNPSVNTCLCADSQSDATSRNITTDTAKTCAVYDPIGGIEDAILVPVLRARMLALQCINLPNPDSSNYNSTGCQADCVQNHGYKSGVCALKAPQVSLPAYGGQDTDLFCECSK